MAKNRDDSLMIHRFRVNNFQSIREDTELDFRIPGTTPERPYFRRSLSRPGVRVPSVIALVGPNGSGKTALLRALVETIRFAAHSYNQLSTAAFVPFLSPGTKMASTCVEVHFEARWPDHASSEKATLFRYTLKLGRSRPDILMPTDVRYEALHSFPKGRPRRIIERRGGKPVYIAKEMKVRPRDDRLAAIPPNASAISALAKMDVSFFPTIAQDIGNVQTNVFGPDLWRPDIESITRLYREDQSLVEKVSDKLQRFDLGIGKMVPQMLPDGTWFLTCTHHGLDTPVVLPNESAGTRHLVHVFPQLRFVLDTGHLAIMDALDADFHTELSAEILDWFRRRETNPNGAQLICSLHNLSVLDGLEKEEVFIVEKSSDGATRVHGARDVAGLRRGGNLEKQYRSGVMGGLPTFG